MTAVLTRLRNNGGLMYRAALSTMFTVAGFGASQAIRLASNLILTRLLFPEAFGMMALVTVFLVGLAMFSDVGTGASIMHSKRGDDPAFLDTAWTIQIIRGVLLWLAAVALAWPVSRFYGEPDLMWYLPVSALMLVIAGFNSTRLQTAHRHMRAGLVTVVELLGQVFGVAVAIVLAITLQSVWALVITMVVTALGNLMLIKLILPGAPNRIRWESAAARELIHFGKWIFVATLCGFVVVQADKVIIGKYLSLADFGLYSIGFFLATFPYNLAGSVFHRILIPIYRESPPIASQANRMRLRKMRGAALAALTVMVALLAFGGPWLVALLYDARYQGAAGIVVLIAILQMPAIIIASCDQAALAAGDSRRYAMLRLANSVLVVAGMLTGLQIAGLEGALIGQGLANLAAYVVLVWLLRPHAAWDPALDAVFFALGALIFGLAWAMNADAIAALAMMSPG